MLYDVWRAELGRWKLDVDRKQMIFYDIDGTTELFVFNIYDQNQVPSIEVAMERRRVL
jgi:hypothetical protein